MTDACVGLPITLRKMFGGHGFFAPNGGMFAAIVTDDEVIFKLVRGTARDELIALGGHPWVYDGSGRQMTMAEWIVIPESFYDAQELLSEWAARAHSLVPAKAPKGPAKKRTAKPARTSTPAKKPTRGTKKARSPR